MTVHVSIVDGPISRRGDVFLHEPPLNDGSPGAVLRFEGLVRRFENDRPVAGLHYETYDPMTERELAALATDIVARHRLTSISVVHSRGHVPVGGVSFALSVAAPHRAEAIVALAEFIDRMKRDVPIWKTPVWAP